VLPMKGKRLVRWCFLDCIGPLTFQAPS